VGSTYIPLLSTHYVNYSHRTPASDAEQTVCGLFMNPDARRANLQAGGVLDAFDSGHPV